MQGGWQGGRASGWAQLRDGRLALSRLGTSPLGKRPRACVRWAPKLLLWDKQPDSLPWGHGASRAGLAACLHGCLPGRTRVLPQSCQVSKAEQGPGTEGLRE